MPPGPKVGTTVPLPPPPQRKNFPGGMNNIVNFNGKLTPEEHEEEQHGDGDGSGDDDDDDGPCPKTIYNHRQTAVCDSGSELDITLALTAEGVYPEWDLINTHELLPGRPERGTYNHVNWLSSTLVFCLKILLKCAEIYHYELEVSCPGSKQVSWWCCLGSLVYEGRQVCSCLRTRHLFN